VSELLDSSSCAPPVAVKITGILRLTFSDFSNVLGSFGNLDRISSSADRFASSRIFVAPTESLEESLNSCTDPISEILLVRREAGKSNSASADVFYFGNQ